MATGSRGIEVVGAAIVRDGRVLGAKRTARGGRPGGWEFPGGKVEVGETREEAVRREVREELQMSARVLGWLSPAVVLPGGLELRVALCEAEGEPVCTEHDSVAWLRADELASVPWLESDVPFLAEVAQALAAGH